MPGQHNDLPFGLYERLITAGLKARLLSFDPAHARVVKAELDPAEAHAMLAQHIEEVVARALNDLPANPLKWDVITSFVDAPSGSMSTLFGNDDAVKTARSGAAGKYPAGSVLSLVSWSQREDPHWFGARVPAEVKSVEFVTLSTGETCAYEEYKGSPLTRTLPDERLAKERCAQLLSVRAAVLP